MKSLIIVFALAIAFADLAHGQIGNIEKLLDEKLEEFRIKMRTGDPEMGLPVMAPYQSDYKEMKMNFANMT